MNKYENIQRDDSDNKKMEAITFVNRLAYVHYDLALYYNNYKPRKYAIFREFSEIMEMANKIVTEIPLFDVYLALIIIYYERALAKDNNLKDIRKTFFRMCKTENVQISFLVDDYVEPDNLHDDEYEMYLAKSVENVISFIKDKYPKIVKRLEEIAKLKVRVTSYMSSLRVGGSSGRGKQTRRNRKN